MVISGCCQISGQIAFRSLLVAAAQCPVRPTQGFAIAVESEGGEPAGHAFLVDLHYETSGLRKVRSCLRKLRGRYEIFDCVAQLRSATAVQPWC